MSRPVTEAEIREALKLMRIGVNARIAAMRNAAPDRPEDVGDIGANIAAGIRRTVRDARAGKLDRRQLFSQALRM